jgi:CRISPR type III-A-associated RAMP protein Csm4
MFPSVPSPCFVVRFRPRGPWRFGPESGARDRAGLIYHSDAVFSAVSSALARLGSIEDWLDATARAQTPAVRFSSFFPFQRELLFVAPPQSVWPPPESAKLRYKGARFAPLPVVEALLADKSVDEDRWLVDGESECLIAADRRSQRGPFRVTVRSNAGIDRLTPGRAAAHSTACLEFAPDAGLWSLVVFADDVARERWEGPVRGAFRLLADSGFGGERSRGWGRSDMPEWTPWTSDAPSGEEAEPAAEKGYWLLSLYLPADEDAVDWKRGSYSTLYRRGRIESGARWGEAKPATLMVAEGSVLLAGAAPRGAARDIAPPGFPHPVFRSGFAVAVPIPWRARP